jgi:hypothetical protein
MSSEADYYDAAEELFALLVAQTRFEPNSPE